MLYLNSTTNLNLLESIFLSHNIKETYTTISQISERCKREELLRVGVKVKDFKHTRLSSRPVTEVWVEGAVDLVEERLRFCEEIYNVMVTPSSDQPIQSAGKSVNFFLRQNHEGFHQPFNMRKAILHYLSYLRLL